MICKKKPVGQTGNNTAYHVAECRALAEKARKIIMTRADKDLWLISAVHDRMEEAERALCHAMVICNHRKNPMYGFKSEDYNYSDVPVRQTEDDVERKQERLNQWNEVLEYAKELIK